MTGFARAAGDSDGDGDRLGTASRSTARALELRLRLPPGFERLEQPARQAVQKRFSRGNFQATLTRRAAPARGRSRSSTKRS